jgi:hypothetical protein
MAEQESTALRKVYFFKIEHFPQLKDSLPDAIARIRSLAFDDSGRYKLEPLSKVRLCAFPDTTSYPLKIRFGRLRRDALPQVEQGGEVTTLELQEDAGLIDICHVIIFDDGFVAAEWNHEGPKLAQLGTYIFEKGRLNTYVKFLNLLERDIVAVVRELSSVRILEIDVPPDAAELAREADESMYTAIKASEALGASKRVGLNLTSEQGSEKLKKIAQRLASIIKNRPQERSRFYSLGVSGYNRGSKLARYVDILESKLVSVEIFPRTSKRARSLKSEEAYGIIEQAYLENRDKIVISATSADL